MTYDFEMTQRPDGADVATWGGHSAPSKNGASAKLARMLVDAGSEDGGIRLMRAGKVAMVFKSLHFLAGRTYAEGSGSPRQTKFVPNERFSQVEEKPELDDDNSAATVAAVSGVMMATCF